MANSKETDGKNPCNRVVLRVAGQRRGIMTRVVVEQDVSGSVVCWVLCGASWDFPAQQFRPVTARPQLLHATALMDPKIPSETQILGDVFV